MFGGGRLALKTLVIDCSPRFLAVRGGGTMLYGINATFGTLISIETTSESLDEYSVIHPRELRLDCAAR
jgi:hypothetical protein